MSRNPKSLKTYALREDLTGMEGSSGLSGASAGTCLNRLRERLTYFPQNRGHGGIGGDIRSFQRGAASGGGADWGVPFE